MKKFLFSMALALGAICMPSQASAAEVASPVANNVKAATPLAAPSGDVIKRHNRWWTRHYNRDRVNKVAELK